MASTYSIKDPSYKDFSNNIQGRHTLVHFYQSNQHYQYGSKNIWLLYGGKNIKEIGQDQRRYSEGQISFPPGREVTRAKPYHKMTRTASKCVCVLSPPALPTFHFLQEFTRETDYKTPLLLAYYTILYYTIYIKVKNSRKKSRIQEFNVYGGRR